MTLAEMSRPPKSAQYAQEYPTWVRSLPIREQVNPKMLEAIKSKDADVLKSVLHTGNKLLRKIFAEETGVKLPSTERDTRKVIDEYVAQFKSNKQQEVSV